MTDLELFQIRLALVEAFLREKGYDGVLLSRSDNFAMATGGKRNYIWKHGDLGSNSLYISNKGRAWFVGNNIEEPRILAEELEGLGCDALSFLWCDHSAAEIVGKEFSGNIVSDSGSIGKDVQGELAVLRGLLAPAELEKYRRLGTLAAEAMTATLAAIEKGTTEADVVAQLVAEGERQRCHVPVALAAADDRIARFRHPLPTVAALLGGGLEERQVQRYVMVVGCFVREGLVVSLTRFRQVDTIPAEVADAYDRVCAVDALMQEATVPGQTLGDVFAVCQHAYAEMGFAQNEWHNHHQGGATGYSGRTCKGSPGCAFPVLAGEWSARVSSILGQSVEFGSAFAWNPSAPGVKSEDTFLLHPDGRREIVSGTPMLPTVDLRSVLGRTTEVRKSGIMPPR